MARRQAAILGRRFGRWIVIDETNWHRPLCRCDCGADKEVPRRDLKCGDSQSCGCRKADMLSQRRMTHGDTVGGYTAEYKTWMSMRRRCYDPNSNRYYLYGAQGITVCDRWLASFEAFLQDMGRKPDPKHSIGRINNLGNYEPDNCRWETASEQARNRRSSRIVTVDGYTCTFTEMAERYGLDPLNVYGRLKIGWSIEDAFKKPIQKGPRCQQQRPLPGI